MLDATFARPDLTTFCRCRLEELGLEVVVGQQLETDRAVPSPVLDDAFPPRTTQSALARHHRSVWSDRGVGSQPAMSVSRSLSGRRVASATPASSRARMALRAAVLLGASAGALVIGGLGTGSAAEAASLVSEKTAPVSAQAKPVVEQAAKQAAPVVEQAAKQAAPVVEQAAKQAAPVVEQAAKQAAPVVEQSAKQAAPVVEQSAKQAAPVVEMAAPVVQAAAPVVEQVVEPAAPVVEQVVEPAAPVVEQVVEPAARVAEQLTHTVAPVVELTVGNEALPLVTVVEVARTVVTATDTALPAISDVASPIQPTAAIGVIDNALGSDAGSPDAAVEATNRGVVAAMPEQPVALSSQVVASPMPMPKAPSAGIPPAEVVTSVWDGVSPAAGVDVTGNAGTNEPLSLPVPVPAPGLPLAPIPAAPTSTAPVGGQQATGGSSEFTSVLATSVVVPDGGLSARMGAEIAMRSSDFVDGLIVPV